MVSLRFVSMLQPLFGNLKVDVSFQRKLEQNRDWLANAATLIICRNVYDTFTPCCRKVRKRPYFQAGQEIQLHLGSYDHMPMT